jgi:aldehyde dehydrogenase (NAD+)
MNPTEIPGLVAGLRRCFESGRTRPIDWRLEQLRRLGAMLEEREEELHRALAADLGKPPFEAWTAETGFTALEVAHVQKHLRAWLRPQRVWTPMPHQLGSSRVQREPLGVVLIIGPWNYPAQLVLAPLIGALAAGNCAVLKPSEIAPRTSAALADLVPRYLDPEAITVVEGGVPETTALLAERFDHIFYTGNGTVGRIVMAAAAKHLTPVTLELGGKSPCLVDRDAELEVSARRIVWGKFYNAGQTCVAPDYVLVEKSTEPLLLDRMVQTLRAFYGEDPRQSPDYTRIVNERHLARLLALLGEGEIVVGGVHEERTRYLAPTILRGIKGHERVMQDEIFGPILPVIAVEDMDEAVTFVNARPKPLALYVYTDSGETARQILSRTSSGGACVNDCISHLAVPELPFGGVGESGMGAYHGRASFETFSHRKSVLDRSTVLDPPIRYPPYSESKLRWAKRLM